MTASTAEISRFMAGLLDSSMPFFSISGSMPEVNDFPEPGQGCPWNRLPGQVAGVKFPIPGHDRGRDRSWNRLGYAMGTGDPVRCVAVHAI